LGQRKIVGYIDKYFESVQWRELSKMLIENRPIVYIMMRNPTGKITDIIVRKMKDYEPLDEPNLKDLKPPKPEPLPEEIKAEAGLMGEIESVLKEVQEDGVQEEFEVVEGMELLLKSNEKVTVEEIHEEDSELLVRWGSGRTGRIHADEIKGVPRH